MSWLMLSLCPLDIFKNLTNNILNYETLPLKLSVNNDVLYRIGSDASMGASDVSNSLD